MDHYQCPTSWSGGIRPYAIPGLSTCLDERRLISDGRPISLSPFESEALRLAEWAIAKRTSVLLCPPDPLVPLSAVIAASAHVADMADAHQRLGVNQGSRRHVAVVSGEFHLRGLYRGLGIRSPGRGGGSALLRTVVPAATFGRDGAIRVMGSGDFPEAWSTIFVRSVRDLRKVGRLDLIVADLPVDDAAELKRLEVPIIAVAQDPSDPIAQDLATKFLTYGWSQADIKAADPTTLTPRLAAKAHGAGCKVLAVEAPSVSENAGMFWNDVGPLVRSSLHSPVAAALAREAFALFYDLVGLALPLEAYEQATAPINVRLAAVSAAVRLAEGEARDLYLPMVSLELRDLAGALRDTQSKYLTLRSTLASDLDAAGDVLLVTRTASLARIYQTVLGLDPAFRRVRVAAFSSLSEQAPAEIAVLTGMAPTWARWVYRSGVASTIQVMAYTGAQGNGSAPVFDEVATVSAAITRQIECERRLGGVAQRAITWSALSGEHVATVAAEVDAPIAPPEVVAAAQPFEVPPGLWEGHDWLAPLEPNAGTQTEIAGRSERLGTAVSAVKLVFADGRWACLEVDSEVTCLRPGRNGPELGFAVRDLEPGDRILFLDGDSRKDLLSKVLEVAEEVPALAVAAAWTGQFRRALAAAYRRFSTYERLAYELHEEGCVVQAQTIRLWVIGVTIGPEDPIDVLRVGRVVEDNVLIAHHAEIVRAIRSLRGAHVQLGRKLAELAFRVGGAAAVGDLDRDEVVDARTGLTVADFQDSVDVLSVASIEALGEVPFILTGSLHTSDGGRA